MRYLRRSAIVPALISTALACNGSDDSAPTSPSSVSMSITGSGIIVRDTRAVASFQSIAMNTAGTVNITQGSSQSLAIAGDDNVLPLINTTVTNGVLAIGPSPNTPLSLSNITLTVDLTMTDLESLTASSAGSVRGQNQFRADRVALVLSSAGNINLDLIVDELSSTLSSVGSLTVSGSATTHRTTLSSLGNLNGFGLSTETTEATLTSLGRAEVSASSRLDVTIGGSGSLFYRGQPDISQRVTGSGRIVDAN